MAVCPVYEVEGGTLEQYDGVSDKVPKRICRSVRSTTSWAQPVESPPSAAPANSKARGTVRLTNTHTSG
jgi:hypothetical protein